MPTRHGAPLGAPCWIDLTTSDVARAQSFYGEVFGWTFESAGPEHGGYVDIAKDGHPVAGLLYNDPHWQRPDGWTIYFHVDDLDAAVTSIGRSGGSNCHEPLDIPDRGRMALATDPSDGFFGLWQPQGHRGFELVGAAGAPVWHQLTTRNYGVALDFYRQVLGWRTETESDTDEFRYTTAWFGDEQLIGVMDGAPYLAEGARAQWTIFFGAEDVDKTLRVIVDNGGTVQRDAEDTPYGRLAAATDHTGAGFNLSSLPN